MQMIEIDFYEGGRDVLLIFTGLGGTLKGYQNKYERIAKQIMNMYHFSVAVVATPPNAWQALEKNLHDAMMFLHDKFQDYNFKVYAMGTSAGANILLCFSYLFPQIKRVLAVNPVLNVNFHWIDRGIKEFTGEQISVISGELDPSSRLIGLLSRYDSVQKIVLPNIDHVFRDNLDKFIELPNRYLMIVND